MLRLENISKKLGNYKIQNVSLEIERGDYFVILGKSGAGKSVLLELISGLLTPDTGKIYLESSDITRKKIQKRNIGIVFQNQSLFPHITVRENILYPLKSQGIRKKTSEENLNILADHLDIFTLLKRKPLSLSLGEAQRVALARTLITNPKCLLLDEPLSSLDVQTKANIRSLLRRINRGGFYSGKGSKFLPQTVVHVTHDYEEAIALATKIAVIEDGEISQTGTPDEIFRHPKSTFVAKFIGIKNFFKGCLKKNTDLCSEFIINYNETSINMNQTKIDVSTDESEGYGSIVIRSEDVTISNKKTVTSAKNIFRGKIDDIENVKSGVEVTVFLDRGNYLSAMITKSSLEKLDLYCGKKVYVSFKATAVKYIKG